MNEDRQQMIKLVAEALWDKDWDVPHPDSDLYKSHMFNTTYMDNARTAVDALLAYRADVSTCPKCGKEMKPIPLAGEGSAEGWFCPEHGYMKEPEDGS